MAPIKDLETFNGIDLSSAACIRQFLYLWVRWSGPVGEPVDLGQINAVLLNALCNLVVWLQKLKSLDFDQTVTMRKIHAKFLW